MHDIVISSFCLACVLSLLYKLACFWNIVFNKPAVLLLTLVTAGIFFGCVHITDSKLVSLFLALGTVALILFTVKCHASRSKFRMIIFMSWLALPMVFWCVLKYSVKATMILGSGIAPAVDEAQVQSRAPLDARLFDGVKFREIARFFADHGYSVTGSKLLEIEDKNGVTVRTYAIYAVTHEDFYSLEPTVLTTDKHIQALIADIELERGMQPGQIWDIPGKKRVTGSGQYVVMRWRHRYNKDAHTATVDLPRAFDAVNESRVAAARDRYADYRKTLAQSLDAINRAANDVFRQRLTLIPGATLEKFNGLSSDELANHAAAVSVPYTHVEKFNGVSNDELIRSGQRVHGGEQMGRAAGNLAGRDEANLGAAAGKIGGFIYDWFSKANDKSRREKEMAAARAQYDREVAAARAMYNRQLGSAVSEARGLFKMLREKYTAQIASSRARPDEPLPMVQIADLDLVAAPR